MVTKRTTNNEQKTRRSHSPEFKAEAAKLVLEQGMSQADVARDLGVSPSLIGRWVHLAREQARPGALSTEERSELQRLRQENKVLRTEREILKKAAAFFAKESR